MFLIFDAKMYVRFHLWFQIDSHAYLYKLYEHQKCKKKKSFKKSLFTCIYSNILPNLWN